MKDGVGLAVALLERDAVNGVDRIVNREHIERLAIAIDQAYFAGLAMVGMIEGVAAAYSVVVADLVTQAGDHSEAIGAGLARRDDGNLIQQIAVAIKVTTGEGKAAEIARNAIVGRAVRRGEASRRRGRAACGIDVAKTLVRGHRAAAVGLDVLEAGIDRQGQPVGQAEARVDADVAGARRIVAAVEFGAAARLVERGRCKAVSDARLRRVGKAREIDVVEALVAIGREAVAAIRSDDTRNRTGRALRAIGAQRRGAEEVVAVAVKVSGDRDEIAAAAERLMDFGVILLLVDDAVIVERIVVLGIADREKCRGSPRRELAGVDHREDAAEVELAKRSDDAAAEDLAGVAGTIVDRATSGRGGRAVDVGRTEADVDLLDQLGVELLVREDGVIARIVERDTVEGQADARAVEAANGQRAARRTVGVIVLEADARDDVDRVEDGLPGVRAGDHFLGQHGLRLGRVGRLDAADILRARAGDDDRLLLEIPGAGRLGERGGRKNDSRSAEQNDLFHRWKPQG